MSECNLKILFLGTPDFASGILRELVNNRFSIAGVVTSPDKPAGRKLKMTKSPVKNFAEQHDLRIFQPEKLDNASFINELQSLDIDVGIVVAFRIMPKILWSLPRLGTFNLHASLLPDYRGAAPINHVIINGEKETGVTTFFLQNEIDAGKIIFNERIIITESDNAGSLHDKLMEAGTRLVIKTLLAIESGNYSQTEQSKLINEKVRLHKAPKIFRDDCRINWNLDSISIHNLIRGLSPYPGAWTSLLSNSGKTIILKIFETTYFLDPSQMVPGTMLTDCKSFLHIMTGDGIIKVLELQAEGKKRMKIKDFLIGFDNFQDFKLNW